MSLNTSENKENIAPQERNDVQMQEEISRLRKLLEVKENELKSSLKTASLKNEILAVKEKNEARRFEIESVNEQKEAKKETIKETEKEVPEKNFEDVMMARKAIPTKAQIKKITRQMKDADVAHQIVVLIDLARFKGVYYAIEIAKKTKNAYVMDRLHDAIVNEFYEEVIKNKKLNS